MLRSSQAGLEDPSLVQGFRAGDAEAVSRVIELCLPQIRHVLFAQFGLSQEDGEDMLQEVRIGVWRGAGRFRAESSLRTYVIQIACNKVKDFTRWRRRHGQRWQPMEENSETAAVADPSDRTLDTMTIENALNQLPARQRQVMDLYYRGGKSYQEIADELGIAVGTVASVKADAMAAMRKIMSSETPGASGRSE